MPVFDFFLLPEITGTQPGITELYLAPKDWFTTVQEAPATGTVIGETATIDTAHAFTSPHGFIQMILIPSKEGLFKVATDGEYPAQRIKAEFEGHLVGLSAAQMEFLKQSTNVRWIALIKDGNCGNDPQVWNFGCNCRPVVLSFEYSTEDNILKVKGETFCAPALYDVAGAIPLEDDTP